MVFERNTYTGSRTVSFAAALAMAFCLSVPASAVAVSSAMAAGKSRQAQPEAASDSPINLGNFRRMAQIIPVESAGEQGESGGAAATESAASETAESATPDAARPAAPALSGAISEGTLVQLILPPQVFLESLRGDGADLCVFNAEGKALPFATRHLERHEVRNIVSVDKLYPLWGKAQAEPEDLSLSFALDAQGRIVPKLSGGRNLDEAPQGQELKGYIIPMPEQGMPVASINFAWDRGQDNTVQFTLQTGDDLKNWRTLLHRGSLVRFDGPDGVLESSQVSLNSARAGKYLRLLFDEGLAPERIHSLSLEQWTSVRPLKEFGPLVGTVNPAKPASEKPQERIAGLEFAAAKPYGTASWDIFPGATQEEAFLFARDNMGSIVVDAIQMADPRPGQYASVRVLTRRNDSESWRYLGDYTFFAITRGDELIQSKPMPLGGRPVGQIRLEPVSPGRALPEDVTLSLTYIPVELYFLAQGPGPYTLAWKGERAVPEDNGLALFLAQQDKDMPRATLGMTEVLSGPAPEPAPYDWGSGNWLKFVLWGLLALGVLLLGGMALNLARSMKKN